MHYLRQCFFLRWSREEGRITRYFHVVIRLGYLRIDTHNQLDTPYFPRTIALNDSDVHHDHTKHRRTQNREQSEERTGENGNKERYQPNLFADSTLGRKLITILTPQAIFILEYLLAVQTFYFDWHFHFHDCRNIFFFQKDFLL